jgi:hypothetical protein
VISYAIFRAYDIIHISYKSAKIQMSSLTGQPSRPGRRAPSTAVLRRCCSCAVMVARLRASGSTVTQAQSQPEPWPANEPGRLGVATARCSLSSHGDLASWFSGPWLGRIGLLPVVKRLSFPMDGMEAFKSSGILPTRMRVHTCLYHVCNVYLLCYSPYMVQT